MCSSCCAVVVLVRANEVLKVFRSYISRSCAKSSYLLLATTLQYPATYLAESRMNAVCCALSARPAARLNSTYQRRWLWVHQWKSFQRWQDLDRDAKVYADEQHRVKNTVKFGDLYLTPERVEQS